MGGTPGVDYLTQSFTSLRQSASVIESLPFRRSQSLATAALASEAAFETYLVRDAEPHERALFQPTPSTSTALATAGPVEQGSVNERDGWTATKRQAPRRAAATRDKASPLKERRTQSTGNDPARALKAAVKLLDIYTLPRAKEHVDGLLAQYEGLSQTITELENALKRPLVRATGSQGADTTASDAAREEEMKREEMECFALQQINEEKQAELDALLKKEANKPKARPKANAAPPPPVDTSSISSLPLAPPLALPTKPKPTTARPSFLELRRAAKAAAAQPAQPSTPTSPSSPRRIAPVPTPKTPPFSRVSPRKDPKNSTEAAAAAAASVREEEEATTPKAKMATPPRVRKPSTPSPQKKQQKAAVVPEAELEDIADKVWNGVGDALRPWARKTLSQQGLGIPHPLNRLSLPLTLQTLRTVLTQPYSSPSENEPPSPASSFAATLTSEQEDVDPLPPSPAQLLEFELLNLVLSTLSGVPPIPLSSSSSIEGGDLPDLEVFWRDKLLPSSLPSSPTSPRSSVDTGATKTRRENSHKDPMVSMTALRLYLMRFCAARGWTDGDKTVPAAIYGLVGKTVFRIDRRGKEGPGVGIKN